MRGWIGGGVCGVVMVGCGPQDSTESLRDVEARLTARIEDLEAENESLKADCATKAEVADAVAALDATYVSHTELDAAVAGLDETYVTRDDFESAVGVGAVDHESRIVAIESTYATVSAVTQLQDADDQRLDALEVTGNNHDASIIDLDARLSTIEGDYATHTELDLLSGEVVRVLDADPLYLVTSAAELIDALTELDHYRIGSGVTVTITLAAGTYTFSNELEIRHPDGAAIRIEGETADPADVVLDFSGASNGIVLRSGQALGYLGGVTILGAGVGSGVGVSSGSVLGLGPMVIESFTNCLSADQNATVWPTESIASLGWLDVSGYTYGVLASESASVDVSAARAHDNDYGFAGTSGATMISVGASSERSSEFGYFAEKGAYLDGELAASTDSGTYGYYAFMGATINARQSQSQHSLAAEYTSSAWSIIGADATTATTGSGPEYYEGAGKAYYSATNGSIYAGDTTGDVSVWNTGLDLCDLVHGLGC